MNNLDNSQDVCDVSQQMSKINISNDEKDCSHNETEKQSSLKNKSRIPRPGTSFSGFQQDDLNLAPKSTPNLKSNKKKGKAPKRNIMKNDGTYSSSTTPRSNSMSSTFYENSSDILENGSWNANKDSSWTYTYNEASTCPVHGTAESVNTLVTGSDPGPSTASGASNTPVLISGEKTDQKLSKSKKKKFNSYMSLAEIQKGLKKGEVLEGVLRINQKNHEHAFISSPQVSLPDIYIGGTRDRNRGFNGDVVAYKIKDPEHWKINEEAISNYEAENGPLFANDQVDFVCNDFQETRPSSNFASVSSFDSYKNHAQNFNAGGDTFQINSDHLGTNDNNLSLWNTNCTSAKPHTIEVFGLENFQKQLDDIKNDLKSDRMNTKTKDTKNELIEEQASGFVVSPEELLLDHRGNLIKNEDVHAELDEDEYPFSTAVAPDQLSDCGLSNDDASACSHDLFHHADESAFHSQINPTENDDEGQINVEVAQANVDNVDEKPKKKNKRRRKGKNKSKAKTVESNKSVEECEQKNASCNDQKSSEEINIANKAVASIQEPECDNLNGNVANNVDMEARIENDETNSLSTSNIKTSGDSKNNAKSRKKSRGKNNMNIKKEESKVENKKVFTTIILPETSNKSYSAHQLLKLKNSHKFLQRTAEVVGILERKHPRIAAGTLRQMLDKNRNYALFCPNDSRIPRMMIPMNQCPKDFLYRPHDYERVLYMAGINAWNETSTHPLGSICSILGVRGEIEAESAAFLLENDIDVSDFPQYIINQLPTDQWTIPADEFKRRRDFRKDCVFTIDPATARDLDDAVSCSYLGDGIYSVGVHIADVSYFIPEGSPLDQIAKLRSTSVYLVQKVIPMLPRVLCERLCSLNPGEDKLTFSVEWKITEQGEIIDEWFGRGIIRSCVKLSYNHAQDMITTKEINKEFANQIPAVSGNFTVNDVCKVVKYLNAIAVKLRKKRFDEGALRLEQVQVKFELDDETGFPYGYSIYELQDSNRLIEEFMLLANMAVAHFLYRHYPDKAFLRRHPEPNEHAMSKVTDLCSKLGFGINDETSQCLQNSLNALEGNSPEAKAKHTVLSNLYLKPMNCAKYFCAGSMDDATLYRHYALSVPLYTHFTSPIRRYADIMVHRQLAAALNVGPPFKVQQKAIQIQAEICNDKKLSAKRASELSSEMFLSLFINKCGPIDEKAIVVGVLDHSFDVLLINIGAMKRVYCDQLPLKSHSFSKNVGVPELKLYWNKDSQYSEQQQNINIFSMVNVELRGTDNAMKYTAILKR